MSTHPADTVSSTRKPVSLPHLLELHRQREPITVLTCYDASFAAVLDAAGVEVLLVGDSLGMVLQGYASTLPVQLSDMAYHTACVARGNKTAWIVADMPFGSYQGSADEAYMNAARLMQAGAHMVKVEGGAWLAPVIRQMTARGIPVCAHLGLTPQSVHTIGGYRVQGKTAEEAARLKADAQALEAAGATLLVLEMVPATVAADITQALTIPTIGIGAGNQCSGQVLVLHDMLNVFPGKKPRFVKNFLAETGGSIQSAIEAYCAAVKSRTFPGPEHSF
jgi:3-methyl-2-oxobutanoate hydroxymethyltransferase